MVKRRFEYAGGAPGQVLGVDVYGELSDWRTPIALARGEDGRFACELDLAPGVYQYKLLTRSWASMFGENVEWVLDPGNERTRSEHGLRNSIAVVAGAPEPWLFALGPPWIEPLEQEGVRVLVGVRRADDGADIPAPTIGWSEDEGETWSEVSASPAFEEAEHVFFVATLPTWSPAIQLALDGAAPRFEARWRRPGPDLVPAWWRAATVYAILVDRFRPEHDRDEWEREPAGERDGAAGGHLEGIRRSLDELADLGIDAIYLTPVHVAASAHRYDIVDPLRVDPALGGEAAYDALVADARARGIRILQDFTFVHAGPGFPAYEDVRKHGAESAYAPWFQWKDGALVHYEGRADSPLLDQSHPDVQSLALEAVAYWAKRGVAGLRLDMAAECPIELGQRIRRRFRELVPDGVVVGELVPQHAWRWHGAGVLDASTDFGFREVVTTLVTRADRSAARALGEIARSDLVRGGDARRTALRLVSSHDHIRLTTLAAAAPDRVARGRVALAYALLFTLPGVPMLLYGEEHALTADAPERAAEDVWLDRMRMPWGDARRDEAMRASVRSLVHARRDSDALREGAFQLLFADETTLLYRRQSDVEIVDVAINLADEPKTIEIDDAEYPRLMPFVALGGAEVSGGAVEMPPLSAMLVRRERAAGRSIVPSWARRNLALRDRDLVLGAAYGLGRATARPSRLHFSITERCNLRCLHCSTAAPERTRLGTARTMTEAVLAALAPDLGFADAFSFDHGGEPLTAPILFDVLRAIRAGRGGEPYVAHVLTNGVLLDVPMAERLVRHGVSSVAVSLDGATAATNDAIRAGGRFHDVRENLRRVLGWRVTEGVDLRVGVAAVVLAQNLSELDAIVDLAADLGADWVRFDEAIPATPFAERSLVAADRADARPTIDAALERGRERGLVMVDRTRPTPIWRCRLDETTRVLLEAEEYASRGVVHPCRVPWEALCIEPDGEVRLASFGGPSLGNVARSPLRTLWNADAAREHRRSIAAERLCGPAGPVVCVGEE